jgi:hypothetical protein
VEYTQKGRGCGDPGFYGFGPVLRAFCFVENGPLSVPVSVRLTWGKQGDFKLFKLFKSSDCPATSEVFKLFKTFYRLRYTNSFKSQKPVAGLCRFGRLGQFEQLGRLERAKRWKGFALDDQIQI